MIPKTKNAKNATNTIDSLPWIEKYRPRKVDNIKLDSQIKLQVKKMIEKTDIPNIIMEGTPGVGKTSTIRCIAREIYGKYYEHMVLEMNASDDRGIKIQESIENFRKAYVHIDTSDKNKIPQFKMVILDEADNMTDKAKYIISEFIGSKNADLRFAFTCNTKDNIFASIQSGCHIINYPPLSDEIVFKKLYEICVNEKIITKETSEKKLKEIYKGINVVVCISNGDLRTAINMLQLTYNRYDEITEDHVYCMHDKPHPVRSKEIITLCMGDDFGAVIKKMVELKNSGYSGTDITIGLRLAMKLNLCDDIPEEYKQEFWKHIGYASYNVSKGFDSSLLQIVACVADMYKTSQELNKKYQKK